MSIQDEEGYLHCGGTIITSNTIVTASHCFIEKATNQKMKNSKIRSFKIVAGSDDPFSTHGEIHFLGAKGQVKSRKGLTSSEDSWPAREPKDLHLLYLIR